MRFCFVDDNDRYRFAPFTQTRPTETLLMGMMSLGDRWRLFLPEAQWFTSQAFPLSLYWKRPKTDLYWAVNPRVIPTSGLVKRIQELQEGEALYTTEGVCIAVHTTILNDSYQTLDQLPSKNKLVFSEEVRVLNHVWELMTNNGRQIFEDFEHLGIHDNRQIQTHYGVVITGNYPVFMDKSAEIEPGVVLIANDGPIYIGKNTKILAGSLIRGPFFLGDYSVVKMGAHLYKDTSVGKYCRIGGEISASIIHSYSNKSHGGYLGNSIIGEWCNLGADTNCSNLKNNYSDVRIQTFPDGKSVSTGLKFLGVMMGDHCKMAINTQINTGSVFGAFTNVASTGFPPKFLEAFSWLTDEGLEIYDGDKAIQTARIMKERRGFTLDKAEQALIEALAIQRNCDKA